MARAFTYRDEDGWHEDVVVSWAELQDEAVRADSEIREHERLDSTRRGLRPPRLREHDTR